MSAPDSVPVELNDQGAEVHPSFGVMTVHRVSMGGHDGGAQLFDSDVRHNHFVTLAVREASRKRNLSRDWIHPTGPPLVEIAMSYAQWGQAISSFGIGEGTPVTITRNGDGEVGQVPHPPRLAQSLAEVKDAAGKSTEEIVAALAEVTRLFEEKAGRKDLADALRRLQSTVDNAPKNMDFAARKLSDHAENVVAKATADIEAAVMAAARRVEAGGSDELPAATVLKLGEPSE